MSGGAKTKEVERGPSNSRRTRTRRQLVAGGALATAALADHDTYPLRSPSFITPSPACAPRRPTVSPALARAALHPPHLSPAALVPPQPSARSLHLGNSSCPTFPSVCFMQMKIAGSLYFFPPLQAIDPGCSSVASGAHTVSTWSVWVAGQLLRPSSSSPLAVIPLASDGRLLGSHPRVVSTPWTMEDEVTPVCVPVPNEAPPRAAACEHTPLLPAPAATGAGKKKKGGSQGTSDVRAFKDDE